MKLEIINEEFTICKTDDKNTIIDLLNGKYGKCEYVFFARTDNEESIVCPTDCVNFSTTDREDEWTGFRIVGELDFSLVGILSKISGLLADNEISIYAVSTYNTDYIFIRSGYMKKAVEVLENNHYSFLEQ